MSGSPDGGGGATPVLTATQTGPNQVTLTWTYSGNADVWHIFRRIQSGTFQDISDMGIPGSARQFVDYGDMAFGIAAPAVPNTYIYFIQTDNA
jgi:hypothetical protein